MFISNCGFITVRTLYYASILLVESSRICFLYRLEFSSFEGFEVSGYAVAWQRLLHPRSRNPIYVT